MPRRPGPEPAPRELLGRAIRAAFLDGESTLDAAAERDANRHRGSAVPRQLGRYRILEEIGRGGVGIVYRAIDPDLDRTIALKVLNLQLARQVEAVERFRDEARLCSSLDHPGIVPVHEIGALDDGRPYFTMRLVYGETLAEAAPRAPRHRALVWFLEIAEVIDFAHGRGLAHGDLKPANILIGPAGSVHVLDWGFTRSLSAPAPTNPTRVGGTPDYMAPEQLREGNPASTATDVYALGAILFEILAEEALADGVADSPGSVRSRLRRRAVDPALAALVADCLDPRPSRRPRAGEVAVRVRAHLDDVERRTRELELSATLAEDRARSATRVRTLTIGLAGCAVALIAFLAWFELGRRARIATAEAGFRRSLARANELLDEARADQDDVTTWDEALEVVRTARNLARHAEVDADLREELAQLEATAIAERERATEDRRMLADLDALRDHCASDLHDASLPARYRRAFADYGLALDGDGLVADLDRIRASSITSRLTTALDDWTLLLSRTGPATGPVALHLMQLSQAADADPLRHALRAAFTADDDALLELIEGPELDGAPPPTLSLASRQLAIRGHVDAAIGLCRRARRRFPDDFALTHDLTTLLMKQPVIDWQEVLLLSAAMVAILPRNPHTWTDHAVAAIRAGRPGLGDDALDRALELDPDYARALIWKGRRLSSDGDRLDGARLLVRGLERQPHDYTGWNALGAILSWEGLNSSARRCLDEALAHSPDNPVIWSNIGLAELKARDGRAALAAFERAASHGADGPTQLCSTGFAQLLAGDFDAAAESFDRGHELSVAIATWSYPSAEWAARARRAAEIAGETADGRETHAAPDGVGADVLADSAWVAVLSGDAVHAVTAYRAAFRADPRTRGPDTITRGGIRTSLGRRAPSARPSARRPATIVPSWTHS